MHAADLLRPDNHELYADVQRRVAGGQTIEHISAVWLIKPDDLLAWVLAYKRPRKTVNGTKTNPYQSSRFPALTAKIDSGPIWSRELDLQRHEAWRKSTAGARKALRQGEQA